MTRVWRESDHPRDREGQFTDKPFGAPVVAWQPDQDLESWLAEQPPEPEWKRRVQLSDWAQRNLERMFPGDGRDRDARLLDAVVNGKKIEESEVAGGQMSATHAAVYERDGELIGVLHKNHSDQWSAEREVMASALGRAIGAPVLAVVMDPSNPEANLIELYDGATPTELAIEEAIENDEDWWDGDGRAEEYVHDWIDQDEGRMLGLFDALWGNTDRHVGNWLIGNNGGMAGIDHTHYTLGHTGHGMQPLWADSPFASHFVEYYPLTGGFRPKDNDMHPDDMRLIAERIAPLRTIFSEEEWRDLQRRLGLLTARAHGTRRRLS